ncbi:aromatic-ring-hydroxylating dioxygenase subunit beta [Gordonia sp. (in: high G+C Gram-positive bacteria)]|uniref:aromatic-ring-hydroxylating dioxygenase subunit beta n=1 Tax=Gordonia sp. (in: high G+C Gram-positive bacteria) TaxID=84139 RepID=UPI00169713C3|nr:aromatic-ring-hydroxylating dioxygenase subunit beta [Gordonia sp. (in: high G+C Gram-positive bacteria)]NLG47947.1 aromatic-ring-hydroxylating dioxygenase subunit beta [Gordonia sp. (in: high G+C Gram-positive bacteria)]
MIIDDLPEKYADTTSFSYHVDAAWYDELDRYRGVLRDEWPASTVDDWHAAQAFLSREARLIDEGRFNDWLDLFTEDCLYWVPVTPGGGNPRAEVSHAFDDHRRLTDRVYWLRTGLAYSQLPASRTRRLITGIETTDLDDDTRIIRSNFTIHEFRAGTAKTYTGWYGHVLKRADDRWRIRLKTANLIDSEQYHENLTLVF